MKKQSVKKYTALACAALCIVPMAAAFCGCSPREEVLKIYNWGDYIEEELLDVFEDWYMRETGKKIRVRYDTFDTNEDMIMRIEVIKADYDLVCPSDYMAERMIKDGLAQKLDKSIFDNMSRDDLYDGLAEKGDFDSDFEYFAPYCWGTFGIMYDVGTDEYSTIFEPDDARMKSWEALWTDFTTGGKKRTLMKDSVRDAYSAARIYANRDKLKELSNGFTDYNDAYKTELKSYFSSVSDEDIEQAKQTLIAQKKVLHKYEVDDGKNDMLAHTTPAWLGFFWSCDTGLIMQEEGGGHFYYEVPKEGSNIWLDGWIIPKYAKNTEAANYFLKFINMYDPDDENSQFAMTNFDYMGTSMAGKAVMEDAKADLLDMMYNELTAEDRAEMDQEDIDYADMMYNREEWFKLMYIDMMFPPDDVLARCEVMRDFGKQRGTDLDSMWIDVKTS